MSKAPIIAISSLIFASFCTAAETAENPSGNDNAQAKINQKSEKNLIKPVTHEDVKAVVATGTPIQLRDAILSALKENLGLAISRGEHEITAENIEIADSVFDPTLTFSSTYGNEGKPYYRHHYRGSSSQTWNNELAVTQNFSTGTEAKVYTRFDRNYNQTVNNEGVSPNSEAAIGVEVTQHLLKDFGREVNLAPIVTAQKNLHQSKLNLRKTTLDLMYDTEIAYWNLSASYALVVARLSSLRYAEFVLEQAKKKRALKSATKEDVLRAEADVASRKVSLVSARQEVQDCDDKLRQLLGQDGTGTLEVYEVLPLANVPAPKNVEFKDWVQQVRAFDIDAQVKEIQREIADLNVTVAENAELPSLDLTLGAEASGRESAPGHAVGGVVDRTGYNLSAGIKFSMPIGQRKAKAELRAAERSRKNADIEIAQAIQNAMFDARSAWRADESARERLEAAKISLEMQEEAFKSEVSKYNVGAGTITDVLSAQDSLDSARLDLIQAALDVATAQAKVNRLDGRILTENGLSWEDAD